VAGGGEEAREYRGPQVMRWRGKGARSRRRVKTRSEERERGQPSNSDECALEADRPALAAKAKGRAGPRRFHALCTTSCTEEDVTALRLPGCRRNTAHWRGRGAIRSTAKRAGVWTLGSARTGEERGSGEDVIGGAISRVYIPKPLTASCGPWGSRRSRSGSADGDWLLGSGRF